MSIIRTLLDKPSVDCYNPQLLIKAYFKGSYHHLKVQAKNRELWYNYINVLCIESLKSRTFLGYLMTN